ncbi:MAG: BspA family leucine-rich repeat surface protein [Flavicella sp.]
MKYTLFFLSTILTLVSNAQTAITDANFDDAIADCLATHPKDGLCTTSDYGSMPEWDVRNVTKMNLAFFDKPEFNADISGWVVSNVTDMTGMFYGALVFNQNISTWDVSKVTAMTGMFEITTQFNQDLSAWDVSNVESFNMMFRQATAFDQELSDWNIAKATDINYMFEDSGLSTDNYDALLTAWSQQAVRSNLEFGAQGTSYCNAANARQTLIDDKGWDITDAGLDCTTAGVNDSSKNEIILYPNPTSALLYIQEKTTLLSICVYDVLGKEVLTIVDSNSIDMSSLASGPYLLKTYDGNNFAIHYILKK